MTQQQAQQLIEAELKRLNRPDDPPDDRLCLEISIGISTRAACIAEIMWPVATPQTQHLVEERDQCPINAACAVDTARRSHGRGITTHSYCYFRTQILGLSRRVLQEHKANPAPDIPLAMTGLCSKDDVIGNAGACRNQRARGRFCSCSNKEKVKSP
jgi:hypothetical protein